jgi:CheY-like chemotaxis protein
LNFQVHCADGGRRALKMLEDGLRVDVLLLDRMMTGMDGMEVLRRVKTASRTRQIPVVMQTAASTPDEVEEGLRAGAHYYLTKPYSPAALRMIVQAALDDVGRRRELEARVRQTYVALRLTDAASFQCRTLDEAAELSLLLSAFCPDPESALTGFTELLTNAIEHGNLGISYSEKMALKREDHWRPEIERRLELPEHNPKRVHVRFRRDSACLQFRIQDDGEGFDSTPYLSFDPVRAFDPNGRGIALAKTLSFPDLKYEGSGNVAVMSVALTVSQASLP